MFVRTKRRGPYTYLMLVENDWVEGKVKQRVLASLGRLDVLQQSGQIDGLLCSLERFSEKFAVLGAHASGESVTAFTRKIGPAMLVERIWRSLGIDHVLEEALAGRRFAFSLERSGRRYIVCLNEDQAAKDRHDRSAILTSLREKLKAGDKALVGNKGYRRYLRTSGEHFQIDEEKIHEEERFDGKWVLTTNADLATADVALQYKQLWTVEDIFRSMKSVLETRPIFHKCDDTIRGHVFCSFLALLIRKEIEDRLAQRKWTLEWADVIASVDGLVETEIHLRGKRYLIRSETVEPAGKVFQACGVALPPTLQQL